MMRRFRALVRKEWQQLWRDPSNLAMAVVLPALLIVLFGYGLSLDLQRAPLAVVLEDSSPAAREMTSALFASPYLVAHPVQHMHQAQEMLRQQQVLGIVRVPSYFSRAAAQGQAQVQCIVHGTDAATAAALQGYVAQALGIYAQKHADRQGLSGKSFAVGAVAQERIWFNSARSGTWTLVPGLVVMVMTLVGGFLTSLLIAREWERGTLEALFITPVKLSEILLSKPLPYFVIGMGGFLLCLAAARFLFHVPLHGSLLILLISSMLYLFTALSLGLLISAAARTQLLAGQMALVMTFMPALMLSGFLFDLNNVPTVIQMISAVIPATYYVELARMSFLTGDDWRMILRGWGILAAQAALFLWLARRRLRKSLE